MAVLSRRLLTLTPALVVAVSIFNITFLFYPCTHQSSFPNLESDKSHIVQSMNSYVTITSSKDENAMATFVATTGPMSVCLDADIWGSYTGGVITSSSNCGTSMNHCVMVTGYNVTSSGMKVWNIRNQ